MATMCNPAGPRPTRTLDRIEGEPGRQRSEAGEPTLVGAFASDGVDLTLIRWMLQRTPTERLRAAQELVDVTWALRNASEA